MEAIADLRRVRSAIERMRLTTFDVVALVLLNATGTAFELLSVGMLYPLFVLAQSGGDEGRALENGFTRSLADFLAVFGVEYSAVTLFIVIFAVAVARRYVDYRRTFGLRELQHRVAAQLQQSAFDRVVRAEIGLHQRFSRGQLFSAIRAHSARAGLIAPQAAQVAVNLLLALSYLVGLFVLQPMLALFIVGTCSPVLFIFARMTRTTKTLGERLAGAVEVVTQRIYAHLDTIRLIKLRGMEKDASDSVVEGTDELRDLNLTADRIRLRMEALIHPIIVAAILLAIYVSFNALYLELAEIGLFFFVIMRTVPLIAQTNTLRYQIYLSLASLDRVADVVDSAVPERSRRAAGRTFERLEESIEFDGVTFQYVDYDSQAKSGGKISDISFRIERGSMVGLVGRSGAGKSTLVDLLSGFYSPDSGRICIDGISLEQFDLRSYRRRISYVTQEFVLVDGTVRENVEYGLEQPLPDAELRDVLRLANCEGFVDELESGWDTEIRERGKRLSGGQRQRLTIARAIASWPQVLILDEPTGSLDSEAEAAIQEALTRLKGEMTIIVIAHRLATIARADQLLMLDSGRIAAQGSHRQLLESSPAYNQLFSLQMHL